MRHDRGDTEFNANREYVVELYHNSSAECAQVFLGDVQVYTDANGVAPIYYVQYPSPWREARSPPLRPLSMLGIFAFAMSHFGRKFPNDNFVFEAYYTCCIARPIRLARSISLTS